MKYINPVLYEPSPDIYIEGEDTTEMRNCRSIYLKPIGINVQVMIINRYIYVMTMIYYIYT